MRAIEKNSRDMGGFFTHLVGNSVTSTKGDGGAEAGGASHRCDVGFFCWGCWGTHVPHSLCHTGCPWDC